MAKTTSQTAKRTRDLQIPLPGTRVVVNVKVEKAATSKAGTNGIELHNTCRKHEKTRVKSQYVCPLHPDKPLTKEEMKKLFSKGGAELPLEPKWVEERKVKGDGLVHIVEILNQEVVGLTRNMNSDELVLMTPGVSILYPADTQPETMKRYKAFHQFLCDKFRNPTRVAQVWAIFNKRTVHGLIRPLYNGFLIFEERFRPEDCKPYREGFEWPEFSDAVCERLSAEGAKAAEGKRLNLDSFNQDAYRERMMELFGLLVAGQTPPEPEPEPEESDEEILDLFASTPEPSTSAS